MQVAAAELDRRRAGRGDGARRRRSWRRSAPRLAPEARAQAVDAVFQRLVRESLGAADSSAINRRVLTPRQEIELTIEKPAAGGRMIARHDGQVVLVAGAVPGERVARPRRARRAPPGFRRRYVDVIERLARSPRRIRRSRLRRLRLLAHRLSAPARAQGRHRPRRVSPHRPHRRSTADRGRGVAGARLSHARAPARRRSAVGFYREGTHTLCDAAATGQLRDGGAGVGQRGCRQRSTRCWLHASCRSS